MTTNDEQYVPDEKTLLDHYEELSLTVSRDPEVAAGNRTEAEKLLARVRRDAWNEGAQAQADTYGGQIGTGPNPYEETP